MRGVATRAGVDLSSPVVFGGLGPHRLEPGGDDNRGQPAPAAPEVAVHGPVPAAIEHDDAQRVRQGSAAAFDVLAARGQDSAEGADAADEAIAPMVRSYSPGSARVRESDIAWEPGVVRTGRAAVRESAVAAAKRERARYVLAASGENSVPVAADDDPGLRVFMYNNGSRNVVDPAEGEYVMGSRI